MSGGEGKRYIVSLSVLQLEPEKSNGSFRRKPRCSRFAGFRYAGTVRKVFWWTVAGLLAAMGTVMVVTALGETQTWDEGIHISAGYAYLKHGDYRWNVEHPPLVKTMSALPLVPLHPRLPVAEKPWKEGDQVQVGLDFLYRNTVPAGTLLFRARSMTILLTLLGGLALAWWTRRRFGAAAALIALVFYAFDPNLIAHGRYVTTDAPMAVFCFLTCAAWCEYLIAGRRRDLAAAALAFALAMMVKFSAVLLIPIVVLLYAIRWCQRPRDFPLRRATTVALTVTAMCVAIAGLAYWKETVRAFYGELPLLFRGVHRDTLAGQVMYEAGRKLHLPLHAYFVGLDTVAMHNQGGHPSYLLGMHSDKGWWYYFPVVLAVKSTMAALAALLLLLAAGACRGFRKLRDIPFAWIAMTVPAAVWFGVATTSGINLGVRHILPVYPLLYAAVGALLAGWLSRPRLRYAVFALLALQAVECASIYPDYLAFFNAASGGPGNGPQYLVDSNIDWGQDITKLSRWLEARGTRRVWIDYFGKADLRYYGIDEASLPRPTDAAGWAAIDDFAASSVTPLYGVYVPLADTEQLRRHPVVAKIGYSIYVYDLRKKKK